MTLTIDLTCDLNCDLGENPARIRDGTDIELLDIVSSANVACGGHAGDEFTMTSIVRAAMERRIAIGAHPGYPDPRNVGRVSMPMSPEHLETCVREQTLALVQITQAAGGRVGHVKPHGALYHDAMHNPDVAAAIGDAILRVDPALVLVAMTGSAALAVWRTQGLRVAGEAFADRTYESDGTLRSRTKHGALISEPNLAAAQALLLVRDGIPQPAAQSIRPQTLCVHSDTPNAVVIAGAVRSQLESAGVRIAPL